MKKISLATLALGVLLVGCSSGSDTVTQTAPSPPASSMTKKDMTMTRKGAGAKYTKAGLEVSSQPDQMGSKAGGASGQ